PKGPVVHEALGRKTADFIGVNYYTKAYVQWRPRDAAKEHPAELPFGLAFARKKEPASDVGWAIHPGGLERVLRMASGYGLPLYVTENGIADHEDSHRASYLCSHLKEIARLRTEKNFDVRGYYYWSLMDNFEWIKGYGPRFGLIRVNFDTFERVPQPSYQLLKDLISTHKNADPTMNPNFEVCKNFQNSCDS
ncbi:MAG: family 1 glycosylhydrolase, partial [Bdellovibrionota bacterium]